ncbi:MAG TPA: hypothetical protein VFL95_03355 [Gemmatimonadales bacterium]|nr:hypothetical protein [Gemmatimonadales bacterium]
MTRLRFLRFGFTALLAVVAQRANAQAPADTAAVLDSVARQVVSLGAAHGSQIWPGYHPDSIPLDFVLPTHGDFLFNWRGALPDGYSPLAGIAHAGWRDLRALGAASTGTTIGGRRVAQVVVHSLDGASLTCTAFHEAFHVFQAAVRRDGRRFGAGENSFYVASYPVFNVDNEAGMALEGRILAAALSARSDSARRRVAREFVATRRGRQQQLDAEFAEFERATELNEGLAQYALVRALDLLVAHGPVGWRASARHQLAAERARLDHLTNDGRQSFRLRFYATGPAMALLLDRLAPGWKTRLMERDETLQDALGAASGLDSLAIAARNRAAGAFGLSERRREADAAVKQLIARREAQADSVLAAPGIKLVARADSLPGRDFNNCGFDPQNLLQISPTVQLQTRWWKPCAGGPTMMELNVPSVHDDSAGTVAAVIGADSTVKITIGGKPVTMQDGDRLTAAEDVAIEAPRATVHAARADLLRRGNTLVVTPRLAP